MLSWIIWVLKQFLNIFFAIFAKVNEKRAVCKNGKVVWTAEFSF